MTLKNILTSLDISAGFQSHQPADYKPSTRALQRTTAWLLHSSERVKVWKGKCVRGDNVSQSHLKIIKTVLNKIFEGAETYCFVHCEPMINACWKSDHVPFAHGNSDPSVIFIPDIKVASPIQDITDLIIQVQVLFIEHFQLGETSHITNNLWGCEDHQLANF